MTRGPTTVATAGISPPCTTGHTTQTFDRGDGRMLKPYRRARGDLGVQASLEAEALHVGLVEAEEVPDLVEDGDLDLLAQGVLVGEAGEQVGVEQDDAGRQRVA